MSCGYDVCGTAQTVEQAVNLANLHKPDLAVLDFRLANGEFSSAIKARLEGKVSMGILYVSGDPLDRKLTRMDGEAYIQKPYMMSDVDSSLQIVWNIKRNIDVRPSLFPKSFHLLAPKPPPPRKFAA